MVASFRVASFNAENFNAPGVRFAGRPGADGAPYEPALYERKLAWMTAILDAGRPDLIGFQELFSMQAVRDAVARVDHLADARIFAPDLEANLAGDPAEASGPFCGIVSRFEITDARSVPAFPASVAGRLKLQYGDGSPNVVDLPVTRFQRPVLRAEIRLRDDVTAVVFVAHLKSKRGQFLHGEDTRDPVVQALGATRSLILRAAEAAALRALVVEAAAGNARPVFVLGDLNDDVSSVTTQAVAGETPFRFASAPQRAAAWDRLLYSAHDIQEQNSYRAVSYTHIFDGRHELLDHIFVSQEFYARNPDRLGEVRNTRIFNDHLTDQRLVAVPDRQKLSATSDHGVVVTEITWKA